VFCALYSQGRENTALSVVLQQIEKNNNTLKTLRETAEAQKSGNKTGIYLDNPDIEFNYLWGKPGEIGARTDISVKQHFDIPTLTGMKSKIADAQNQLVAVQYKSDRMNILLEAKQYCIELIYYNALRNASEIRLQHAGILAASYQSRLENGDASRLEYNKAQLNLATVQGEIARIDVERSSLLSQLKRLNGGIDIAFDESQYDTVVLPANFDEWFAQAAQKYPVLEYARQQIAVNKKQVSLNKAMGLPTFSAGYMSEKVVGQHYQGITLGVSLPLWENKNRVKQAKAMVIAAESHEADIRRQFYDWLQIHFNSIAGLNLTAEKYRQALAAVNNADLLKKALDVGEISLLNYITELEIYYKTVDNLLATERDLHLRYAELQQWDL
jgi:outer membrane protein TolC